MHKQWQLQTSAVSQWKMLLRRPVRPKTIFNPFTKTSENCSLAKGSILQIILLLGLEHNAPRRHPAQFVFDDFFENICLINVS